MSLVLTGIVIQFLLDGIVSQSPISVPQCTANMPLKLNGFTLNCTDGDGDPKYDTNVYLCYNKDPLTLEMMHFHLSFHI